MISDFLETAHIHLEQATFRVHVNNSTAFDIKAMNEAEDKPDFVLWTGRSNDPEQKQQSILVTVVLDYDLVALARWIKCYEK